MVGDWEPSGFAVLATLMVIVFPTVTQRVIDEAIRGQKPELILPLALLAAGAFFVQSVSNGIRIILNNTFEQKVIFDLRSDLYNHIQTLPLRWFDNRATGDIMTRVLEDVNAMERVLIDGVEQGTVAILQVLIVGVLLFVREPWLATLTMLPIPLSGGRRTDLHLDGQVALQVATAGRVRDELIAP